MQPEAGKLAIALSEQLLFSRTTSDVDPLPPRRNDQALNILLVFGQSTPTSTQSRQQRDGQRKILPDWPWQQKLCDRSCSWSRKQL